jgi:hypothetical protein
MPGDRLSGVPGGQVCVFAIQRVLEEIGEMRELSGIAGHHIRGGASEYFDGLGQSEQSQLVLKVSLSAD